MTTTLRRLDALDAPIDVVLGGGMLTSRHPALLEPVIERIAAAAPRAAVAIVDADPSAPHCSVSTTWTRSWDNAAPHRPAVNGCGPRWTPLTKCAGMTRPVVVARA